MTLLKRVRVLQLVVDVTPKQKDGTGEKYYNEVIEKEDDERRMKE